MVRVALFSSGSLWSPRSHLNPATFGRPGSSTKQVMVNGRFFITCWGSYEIEAGPGLSVTYERQGTRYFSTKTSNWIFISSRVTHSLLLTNRIEESFWYACTFRLILESFSLEKVNWNIFSPSFYQLENGMKLKNLYFTIVIFERIYYYWDSLCECQVTKTGDTWK